MPKSYYKAKVEVDPANGKFRINLFRDNCYSPWTSPKKMASVQHNKDVFLATMRTRPIDCEEDLKFQLVAEKVYRVALLEELEAPNA